MSTKPNILMCPPEFYGIHYEINPWMNTKRQADHDLAASQWSDLRKLLIDSGAQIETINPVSGLPDLVFTANAALIQHKTAILSRFRHHQRQGEEQYDEKWLEEKGYQVIKLPEEIFFEGAGDALFCGETLFAGYRMRSDVQGHQQIGELLDCRVIPMELVDPYYYHLDTCFCPLAPGQAAYYPGAFDSYGRDVLTEFIDDLIEVDEHEAESFACNAVVVERNVITNSGCPKLHRELRAKGFHPLESPLSEFVKAGGSAKCLTLRLDGEEAAAWKHTSTSNTI